MKKILLYIIFPISVLIVSTWAFVWNYIYAQEKAHQERLEEARRDLEKEKYKKSEIEKIENLIEELNSIADMKEKEISEARDLVREKTEEYETTLLKSRCANEQLTLKVNWKEYNIKQCEDREFIQRYRKK